MGDKGRRTSPSPRPRIRGSILEANFTDFSVILSVDAMFCRTLAKETMYPTPYDRATKMPSTRLSLVSTTQDPESPA